VFAGSMICQLVIEVTGATHQHRAFCEALALHRQPRSDFALRARVLASSAAMRPRVTVTDLRLLQLPQLPDVRCYPRAPRPSRAAAPRRGLQVCCTLSGRTGRSQFKNGRCGVVASAVSHLEAATDPKLPRCSIRAKYRWWHDAGVEACLRCPTVVTADMAGAGTDYLNALPMTQRLSSSP
jgi:hypothetical protein